MIYAVNIPQSWIRDMRRGEFTKVDDLCTRVMTGIPFAKYPMPVRGKWIHRTTKDGKTYIECSRCRHVKKVEENFCGKCGADMRGDE